MTTRTTQHVVVLGLRIGLAFLTALIILAGAAYVVMSGNIRSLLIDYSFNLFDSMVEQGVKAIDQELRIGLLNMELAANRYAAELEADADAALPFLPDSLRTHYTSASGTKSSDGRVRDMRWRKDVRDALEGKTTIFGPAFNTEGEYIIGYTAPVRAHGRIIGALGVEKDGYLFCRLIADYRFLHSGESYIINAEGTDIAVSDPNHIEWVNTQYNARRLLQKKEDPVTRAIADLEQKGLDGETGRGSYTWNGGVAYMSYAPVTVQPWVFFVGIREEELAGLTKTVFYSSLTGGSILQVCFVLFMALSALIVFWIINSVKKTSEINKKLEQIANVDALTGLYNRRYLENVIERRWQYPVRVSGHATVFMADIDDFKQYNDHFGHPQGDECLRRIAGVFRDSLHGCDGYAMRYGGEEFMAVVFQMDRQAALRKGHIMCRLVEAERIPAPGGGHVTLSVGVCYAEISSDTSLQECIEHADHALYQAKSLGKNRCVLFEEEAEPSPALPVPASTEP